MRYAPITGPLPRGDRPAAVDDAEQTVWLWWLRVMGAEVPPGYTGVPGVNAATGEQRPAAGYAQTTRYVAARQGLDGRWYLPLPAAKRMRVRRQAGDRVAVVNLRALEGTTISEQGRSLDLPIGVELDEAAFPLE